jgi:hypothetical protein
MQGAQLCCAMHSPHTLCGACMLQQDELMDTCCVFNQLAGSQTRACSFILFIQCAGLQARGYLHIVCTYEHVMHLTDAVHTFPTGSCAGLQARGCFQDGRDSRQPHRGGGNSEAGVLQRKLYAWHIDMCKSRSHDERVAALGMRCCPPRQRCPKCYVCVCNDLEVAADGP